MNVDGSGQVPLTHGAARNFLPAWSPDGGRIAFISDPNDAEYYLQVHLMNADGSGGKRLTQAKTSYFAPSWAPDGKQIAVYTVDEATLGLFDIDADGAAKVIPFADSNMSQYNLYEESAHSSWSPDGKRIAFTVRGDGFFEIRVRNPQEVDKNVPLWQGQGIGQDYYMPAWSPDGKRIAFVSGRDGNSEIYVIDADGANPKRLTHNAADDLWPSWSPDGAKIAFASQRYGNWEIYMMDADGGNPTRMTDSPEKDTQPSWSPFLK